MFLLAIAMTEPVLAQPLSDTCDTSGGDTCESGGGLTQWPPVADTRSLVQALDQKATYLVIRVDDLEDRIVEEEADGPPRSRDTRCYAAADKNPEGTGKCTLRAALELAATASAKTAVTLALRGGRFLLQGALPEITGTVQIVGTVGRASSGNTRPHVDPWSRTSVPAEVAEEEEAVDPHWQPRTGPGPGPTGPIGTLLDGGARHQILRAGRASALHLMTLRLEGGRALRETADDQRAALGGAVSSLGKLVMTNTVVHDNQAVNGGALYTEGEFEMQSSLLQHNKASNCGGALYAQTGPRVHLDSCTIRQNHDNCGRRQTGNLGDKSGPSFLDGKKLTKPVDDGKGGGKGKDALGGRDLGGGAVDVSGAIAQGGPLTDLGGTARHTLTAVASSSDDKADAATAAGADERKGSKRKGDKSGGKRSRPPPPPVACDPNGHGGARGELLLLSCPPGAGPAIGAFGSAGSLLDSLGLICEDGTSTATGGHGANGAPWRFACPGWRVCTDSEPKCTDWAGEGECNANPGWMHSNCRFSCGVCSGDDAPIREAQSAAAIVGIEVRAGESVDAIRFECGKEASASASGKKMSKGSSDASSTGRAALSPWYGGSGGAPCELGCANGTAVHRVQMRVGGAGVGRVEMSNAACRSGVAAGTLLETGTAKGKARRSSTNDAKGDGGAPDGEAGITWQRDAEAF